MRFVHFFLILLLLPLGAFAGVDQLSPEEFRDLAQKLAPKVNLFSATWSQDPHAEFYGGTTRDFLYWVKGKFIGARSHKEALKIVDTLLARPKIDVREFIVGDSDVDIVSRSGLNLNAVDFGVRKIDSLSPAIFEKGSELYHNELNQGYIPAEKIRLGKSGFAKPADLGDGLSEIYSGKLRVVFTDEKTFASTKYAKEGVNHPILLALRYLRLQAINYYQTYGQGYPDSHTLLSIDPEIEKNLRRYIGEATTNPKFKELLKQNRFVSWLNGSVQKAFRSYTNPTAALLLMKHFGVDQLPAKYPQQVEPINQYVFSQFREPKEIDRAFEQYKVDKSKFFGAPKTFFPDGYIYHGTKTEPAFRTIVLQGVLGSEGGSAGEGLYGVAEHNKAFSEKWGGTRDRLLRLPVKDDAKITDITTGEGASAWSKFSSRHGNDYEEFARIFGADIVKYPYKPEAFVVKNSDALGRAQGVYREVLSIDEFIDRLKGEKDIGKLFNIIGTNNYSSAELEKIWENSAVTPKELAHWMKANPTDRAAFTYAVFDKKFIGDHDVLSEAIEYSAAHTNEGADRFITADLARFPDLVERVVDKKMDNEKVVTHIAPLLQIDDRVKILHKVMKTGNVSSIINGLGDYDPKLLGLAEELVKNKSNDISMSIHVFPRAGWETQPQLLQKMLEPFTDTRGSAVADVLLHWGNAPGTDAIVRELVKNGKGDTYYSLFGALQGRRWEKRADLVELSVRGSLNLSKSVGGGFDNTSVKLARDALKDLLKSEQWANNPELLKITNGKPVTLENLRAGFAAGRTLLPAEDIPARGFGARCGDFFARFR